MKKLFNKEKKEEVILVDENGNPIEVELSAEGLALTCVYDYNTPVTIEVPAEALQAPASSESAENALEDVLGGIAG